MDILCLLGGAFIGSMVAGLISTAIPGLETPHRLAISLVGCFFGLGFGYWMLWITKQEEVKRKEEQKARAQARNPKPPQIVGNKCTQCKASIIFIADGHICPSCMQVKCKACEPTVPCQPCTSNVYVAEVVE